MARTVRSADLETRTARLRLKPRAKPYFVRTGKKGLILGYRRTSASSGSWVAKRYLGRADAGGRYATSAFAQADDFAEADGQAVLTYHEAIKRIESELSEVQERTRYTVNRAVDDYVAWARLNRKSAKDTEGKLRAYLSKYFDGRLVSELTPDDFDKWARWAPDYRPPGRRKVAGATKAAKKKRRAAASEKDEVEDTPPPPDPAELRRRRRATLNRVINAAKACLNRAFLSGHVPSDAAWRRLRRFKSADSVRVRWLTVDECMRLANACDPDFRAIVQAGMLTGARWSELRNAKVGDYDPTSKTLLIADSKGGKARRIPLTEEGEKLLDELTAGRPIETAIFRRTDGRPWGLQDQKRPILAACAAAKIKPAVTFHVLRHTYASLLTQAGVSLAIVAEALGHADTRMVSKHYGHLAPSHVADAIRAKLPKLGVVVDGKVRRMRT